MAEVEQKQLNVASSNDEGEVRRVKPSPAPHGTESPFDDSGADSTNSRNSGRIAWGFRPQSPAANWGPPERNLPIPDNGRVAIFDATTTPNDDLKLLRTVYHQILTPADLAGYFRFRGRKSETVLFRIFHVQNARWALDDLAKRFDISGNPAGEEFLQFAQSERSDPGGKPYLSGKSWPIKTDYSSGTKQMYMSFDYLKSYKARDPLAAMDIDGSDRMMELHNYDAKGNPEYSHNVAVQRLACFFQRKGTEPLGRDFSGPGDADATTDRSARRRPRHYDFTDAAVIFDESRSRNVYDTLIPARGKAEKDWEHLQCNVTYGEKKVVRDIDFYPKFIRAVLEQIFNHLRVAWEDTLDLANVHQTILENKIYERPADESHAQELWSNSSQWLRVEKLMARHQNLIKSVRKHAGELTTDLNRAAELDDPQYASNGISNGNKGGGLAWEAAIELQRLSDSIQSDLVKSTVNLITLLYQSVAIRDSRHSIELGASMWRLSWITFIFLPLTFISGLFGMNVSWWDSNPPGQWYIVAAVVLLVVTVGVSFLFKRLLARQRRTPHQRGLYESFFHDLAMQYPVLWSRVGPRDIVPKTRLGKMKWFFIKRWSAPEQTIQHNDDGKADGTEDDLGLWPRWKRGLIRRWTSEIRPSTAANRSVEDGRNVREMRTMPSIGTVMGTPPMHGFVSMHPRSGKANRYLHPRTALPRSSPTRLRRRPPASTSNTAHSTPRHESFALSTLAVPHNTPSPLSSPSHPYPSNDVTIISEEDSAQHIANCGKRGKGWRWSGGRRTGSSREGEWIEQRRKRRKNRKQSKVVERGKSVGSSSADEGKGDISGEADDGDERPLVVRDIAPSMTGDAKSEAVGLGLNLNAGNKSESENERAKERM